MMNLTTSMEKLINTMIDCDKIGLPQDVLGYFEYDNEGGLVGMSLILTESVDHVYLTKVESRLSAVSQPWYVLTTKVINREIEQAMNDITDERMIAVYGEDVVNDPEYDELDIDWSYQQVREAAIKRVPARIATRLENRVMEMFKELKPYNKTSVMDSQCQVYFFDKGSFPITWRGELIAQVVYPTEEA